MRCRAVRSSRSPSPAWEKPQLSSNKDGRGQNVAANAISPPNADAGASRTPPHPHVSPEFTRVTDISRGRVFPPPPQRASPARARDRLPRRASRVDVTRFPRHVNRRRARPDRETREHHPIRPPKTHVLTSHQPPNQKYPADTTGGSIDESLVEFAAHMEDMEVHDFDELSAKVAQLQAALAEVDPRLAAADIFP